MTDKHKFPKVQCSVFCGEILTFIQKDGNKINIIVYEDGIGVKAEDPGTKLEITRGSSYFVKAIAV